MCKAAQFTTSSLRLCLQADCQRLRPFQAAKYLMLPRPAEGTHIQHMSKSVCEKVLNTSSKVQKQKFLQNKLPSALSTLLCSIPLHLQTTTSEVKPKSCCPPGVQLPQDFPHYLLLFCCSIHSFEDSVLACGAVKYT